MKLTKLELSGFKSFADTVSLTFEEGVTAIVGPNGCGKSNVSDSVRWVLGEQSARLLRGGKMEDVIFQGSAARRPVNVTEVSLFLDNTDGELPIAYRRWWSPGASLARARAIISSTALRCGSGTFRISCAAPGWVAMPAS